jgi:hypothetical protein
MCTFVLFLLGVLNRIDTSGASDDTRESISKAYRMCVTAELTKVNEAVFATLPDGTNRSNIISSMGLYARSLGAISASVRTWDDGSTSSIPDQQWLLGSATKRITATLVFEMMRRRAEQEGLTPADVWETPLMHLNAMGWFNRSKYYERVNISEYINLVGLTDFMLECPDGIWCADFASGVYDQDYVKSVQCDGNAAVCSSLPWNTFVLPNIAQYPQLLSASTLANMRGGTCDPDTVQTDSVWTATHPLFNYGSLGFLRQCAGFVNEPETVAAYSSADFTVLGLVLWWLNVTAGTTHARELDANVFLPQSLRNLVTFLGLRGNGGDAFFEENDDGRVYTSFRRVQDIANLVPPMPYCRDLFGPRSDFDVSSGGFDGNGMAFLKDAARVLFNTLSLDAPDPLVQDGQAYAEWVRSSRIDLNRSLEANVLSGFEDGTAYNNGMFGGGRAGSGISWHGLMTYFTIGTTMFLQKKNTTLNEDMMFAAAVNADCDGSVDIQSMLLEAMKRIGQNCGS